MGSGTYGLAYIQDVSFFTAKNVLALPSRKYESYSFSTPSFILANAKIGWLVSVKLVRSLICANATHFKPFFIELAFENGFNGR